jgi:hypothetical protein
VKGATQETQVPSQPIATIISMTVSLESTKAEDGDVDMELDEKNLAEVDLEHLEHAYRHHKIFTIPPNQLRKVHKIFLNSSAGSTARSNASLGIHGNTSKGQCKPQKDEKKQGSKSISKIINEI